MLTPKYEVGQLVAVYYDHKGDRVVIPETRIREIIILQKGRVATCDGRVYRVVEDHVCYRVEGDPYGYPEYAIRPINPDEYIESEEPEEIAA